jgi:hypothetical protein
MISRESEPHNRVSSAGLEGNRVLNAVTSAPSDRKVQAPANPDVLAAWGLPRCRGELRQVGEAPQDIQTARDWLRAAIEALVGVLGDGTAPDATAEIDAALGLIEAALDELDGEDAR